MKSRQAFLASLEEAGVLCIDSEIPHAAYLLDDGHKKLAILPPAADGEKAAERLPGRPPHPAGGEEARGGDYRDL